MKHGQKQHGQKQHGQKQHGQKQHGQKQGQTQENSSPQHETVRKLIKFQDTGRGFDDLWNDLAPIVEEFARRCLRTALLKGGVKSAFGDVEEGAGEVMNDTVLRLQRLAEPGAGGRFNPAKAKPGLSGLRGWMWKVVKSQAVNWVRDFRGGRGLKITAESGLAGRAGSTGRAGRSGLGALGLNDLSSGGEGASFLDRRVAKMERADLLPILEECIAQLPDPLMREMVRLKLDAELSVRGTADRLKVADSKVQRRLTTAYEMLRPMLEARGVDATWLAA